MDMNDRSSSAFGRVVWRAAGEGNGPPFGPATKRGKMTGREGDGGVLFPVFSFQNRSSLAALFISHSAQGDRRSGTTSRG